MIEPVRCGQALLDEIAATRPASGSVTVWWLGQSGFLLKSSDATIVVDPYLSEHLTEKYAATERPHVRMTRAPIRGADLTGIDLLLASHKHSDHLDPGTAPAVLAASSHARLVLPAAILEHAESLGIRRDRMTGLKAGEVFRMPGVAIRAVPSAHEGLDTDDRGRHLYLGFVIEIGNLRLYHSGDTLAYDGLDDWLGSEPFDLMFLPINGRDRTRGVPGNMTAAEAIALARSVRPRFVVPHHYDMFTFNTVPVHDFEEAARMLTPEVRPRVLQCGERWEVHR